MEIFNLIIGIVSFLIAAISIGLTIKSLKLSNESTKLIDHVKKELELEFDESKTSLANVKNDLTRTNEKTQELLYKISKLFESSEENGLEMVYTNRMDALSEFKKILQKEVQDEIVIIGSSLLGLFLYINEFEEIIKMNPNNFKFILTHPDHSSFREGPEGRSTSLSASKSGMIKVEICEYINKIVKYGVPDVNIQLYKGPPSVFTIITKNHMLLNPYPSGTEAYRCFCIQVRADSKIFNQYYNNHYKKIWNSEWIEEYKSYERRCNDSN